MAFGTYKSSQYSSRPIELFTFSYASTNVRLTNAQDEITIGLNVWIPTPISRSDLAETGEDDKDVLEIELPADNAVSKLYVASVPGLVVAVTVQQLQRLDIGGDNETLVIFKGRVLSGTFNEDGTKCKLAVAPLTSKMALEFPRFRFNVLCNHYVYDEGCKLDETSFDYVGNVLSVVGRTLQINGADGFAAGYFTGGIARASTGEERMILEHDGTEIILLLPFTTDVDSTAMTLFAGCDLSIATCKAKFNNVINFGGYAFVPRKDPFTTGVR